MRWLILAVAFLSTLTIGIWLGRSEPVVVMPESASIITAKPSNPVSPITTAAPTITESIVKMAAQRPTPEPIEQQINTSVRREPTVDSNSDQLNALLANTVNLDTTGSTFRSYWREIWPLSRQRDAFAQPERTIQLIQRGLQKHGWRSGNAYLALAAQMQKPDALGPIMSTYWQHPDAIDEQNWRPSIRTLTLIQAGDKVAYLAETQAFCTDLSKVSELASASCFGSLLDGYNIVLQLNNLQDSEAVIALVNQALQQPSNITNNLLNAVLALNLPEPDNSLLNIAMVTALAQLPLEDLRRPPVDAFVRNFSASEFALANGSQAQQDDLLDPLSLKLYEYHRLYTLAATTEGANITDNWLDRASEQGVELMLFGKDMILTAYQNPEQNKLIDDLNRYALKLYQHSTILAAMEKSIEYCQQKGQADLIGLQLMDLVTFQSPGRDSEFNRLYQQLVQCHSYPS